MSSHSNKSTSLQTSVTSLPQKISTFNEEFMDRHIGPDVMDWDPMLSELGFSSLENFIDAVVPKNIRLKGELKIGQGISERECLIELKELSRRNKVFKNYLGMGYSDCMTPSVILRNVLENPGWYTQYTPYQSEISQGRLEALLNFQTLISDLTGLPISNASLLDEATAAAEAMTMCWAIKGMGEKAKHFFISSKCHPQVLAVMQTRAEPLGIQLIVGDPHIFNFETPLVGGLVQYPDTFGVVEDFSPFIAKLHEHDALAVVSADLLSLVLLKAPGEFGADICVGSAQRFGVPMGYGGPHAAFLSTRDEFKRKIPGRLVGVSKDADGNPAIRLALQTREQHIRRDKATSNICTAQVLLAIMASMYAVYHGPKGLKKIASRTHAMAVLLQKGLSDLGVKTGQSPFFDTLKISLPEDDVKKIINLALNREMNFRLISDKNIGITVDETTTLTDVENILGVFQTVLEKNSSTKLSFSLDADKVTPQISSFSRVSPFLTHSVFNSHHSETEMLRYLTRLQAKDLSLTTSMIPLGSCTMKLNSTTEMMPVTWNGFSKLHPFCPADQAQGYREMNTQLEAWLAEITGFAAVSLQPNAGSQGEYAGLLVIRKFHETQGDHRNVCLIPSSAHGTNPASAAMAGMKVVVVACDKNGNIDINDLKAKAAAHQNDLSCLMVTYPSTHGVFEEGIRDICEVIHRFGGQVYMDGANMNAQVGLCRPGDMGADVCHLNLHKTFCIPHGGGGPGMGPIGVGVHLKEFLPSHPVISTGGTHPIGAIAAAPFGSASILPISYAYIRMMGSRGLTKATEVAILNANYIAKKLNSFYPVLYKGKNNLIAHECILDLRPLKAATGVEVEDVAKRLMDYGFHAPTVSFPVPGTLMIEPTESEPLAELDRFCEAMILIRKEIAAIEEGKSDRHDNPLKNAPHTAQSIAKADWKHSYSREEAVYPATWLRHHKYWPPVSRIDNVYGDRNVMCTCPSVEEYA